MIKRIILGTLTALAVSLTATDVCGNTSTHTQTVRVGDDMPPIVVASVEKPPYKRLGYLWSPDHGMIDLESTVSASDDCDPEPPTRKVRAAAAEGACDQVIDYVLGERDDIPLGFFEVGEPGASVIGNKQ